MSLKTAFITIPRIIAAAVDVILNKYPPDVCGMKLNAKPPIPATKMTDAMKMFFG